ncbi:MAG: hypothetical protein OXI79_14310 [Gammaproteobacteria bacterium]|nr:hypothetical protein [Gammaproteobacteria bacterium]
MLSALLTAATLTSGCVGISIEELTELAEQGDTEAAYDLAHAYYAGKGVDRDLSSAKTWFSRAARQGHPCAATYVGRIFDQGGFGVEQDEARALDWYTLGTESRDVNAYLIVGLRHLNPEAGEPTYEEAAKWLEDGLGLVDVAPCVASSDIKARGLFHLAMMYFDGRGGLERAKSHSLALLEESRKQRSYVTTNAWTLGDTRYTESTRNTPALAASWIESAATEHGFGLAYALLGEMYAKGINGVEKDAYKAYIWYSMALRAGHLEYLPDSLLFLKELSAEEAEKAKTEIDAIGMSGSRGSQRVRYP